LDDYEYGFMFVNVFSPVSTNMRVVGGQKQWKGTDIEFSILQLVTLLWWTAIVK